MQDLSFTSIHGWAITYVTSNLRRVKNGQGVTGGNSNHAASDVHG